MPTAGKTRIKKFPIANKAVLNEAYEPLIAPFYEVHVRRSPRLSSTTDADDPSGPPGDESTTVVRLRPVSRRPGVSTNSPPAGSE